MKETFSAVTLRAVFSKLETAQTAIDDSQTTGRSPVHVVYGGANLFKSDTARKLGKLALKNLQSNAPDFSEFARAIWLKGADALPKFVDVSAESEKQFDADGGDRMRSENYDAWFALTIYRRTIEKLKREPVEDFRIDFEDGYGIRSDREEDADCISASDELAKSFLDETITPFCGFRIKSLALETGKRAVRTLDLFLTNLLDKTGGKLPENFVVTLPKITRSEEVSTLDRLLIEFEKRNNLENGSIKIEIMIETPQAIVAQHGAIALPNLVKAANGRCASAHFGAYDYTAALGISGAHQHLRHDACNFARQMMQIVLSPLGVRLADSVTTEMPILIYKGDDLTEKQIAVNKRAVQTAWRAHFNNVTGSLINGFYQSWDLHPAQLPARYAAVYQFFLESKDAQSKRLKSFIERATQASLTGNQFDDQASAQGLINFFGRALSCGAMTEAEIVEETDLSVEELRGGSFIKIMENRRT